MSIRRLLQCAVALVTLLPSSLAAQTDVIRGRVTGVEGEPLMGVRVTATSIPGNVTRQAHTNQAGNYQIVFPGGTGDYMMGYAIVGYGYRQMQIKRLADEAVLVADARLSPVQLDSIMVAVAVQQRVSRNQEVPDVSGTERPITSDMFPSELQGNIAAMAASLPGVTLVPGLDGSADQFSVFGLDPDQNSVTLNGMEAGLGNLPRDAAVSSSLTTSPFDVGRGGFSAGNFNVTSRPGSNFQSRGMSLVMTGPPVQWTDDAARALGNDYTNISLGGMASGPIRMNKAFYNVSYQLGRQSRDNGTLLNTSALGLQTAGIAMDSVSRFLDILQGNRIPAAVGEPRSSAVSDNGSLFASFDFSPPTSSSGQSIGLTLNGNWSRQSPVGADRLALESAAGDRTNWGGGVQATHSAYMGMVLSETSAGINTSRNYGDPYLELPGGRVRVNSDLDDGGNGVQTLTFGGNQGMGSSSSSLTGTFQNNLSWFDNDNRHRIKLTSELSYSGNTQEQASNLLGSFFFNSLEDFEAGRPASFTRTLTEERRSTGQLSTALALGDSWRWSPDLQLQYGLRLDYSRYTRTPAYNTLVETIFDRRNDRVPAPVSISPRIGFSWTVGRAQEINMFEGAARRPRAVIRGGIGVFTNNLSSGQIGGALSNTGLPGGAQYINCVGPAVPLPDWSGYADDPATVPDRCADGTSGTVFSSTVPNVTLFASDYAPTRTVRSNLSWSGSVIDSRFSLNVEGTYSLNLNQQRSLDLNFDAIRRFDLGDDGRPVYVATSSIVPATGAIASRDARVSQDFNRVTEMRSDLESRTAQLSLRLSPVPRGPTRFGWSLAYTYSHIREQVSGFSSTAGDPLTIEWARASQGPHQINYSLRYRFFDAVDVSWNGSFRSGNAFTPMVAGDINGDGYANDRAFVFSPLSASDPTVASGMSELLEHASGATRECLEKQVGQIAARNSCRGPWSSNASLGITLDRAKFRMPQRASVTFSVTNPLGGADLLLNGSDNLKGWGQSAAPDQSLLYVRGYDATTQRYQYEVNQRFGATRPQFMTLRQPVILTASVRLDLGPSRERQMLSQQLRSGRTMPGQRFPEQMFRAMGASLPNPMSTILRQQDSLRLNTVQADSIAAMNRRYTYRTDSLWRPVARGFTDLPDHFDEGAAYATYLRARRTQVDMLAELATAVRQLLTSEQRRKLPSGLVNYLDPRYLEFIRDGNLMYVSGSSIPFMGGGMPVFFESMDMMVIRR